MFESLLIYKCVFASCRARIDEECNFSTELNNVYWRIFPHPASPGLSYEGLGGNKENYAIIFVICQCQISAFIHM